MKEFVIDNHITLRLIKRGSLKTIIFVDGEEFMQCKYLLIINPQEKEAQKEIKSVDEASKLLVRDLERELKPIDLGITPEQEFWGHCSNLQVWVENNYDQNIIHTNLGLPLLKKLAENGVPKAKSKFREVVIETFEKRRIKKILYLFEGEFFKFFNYEEYKELYHLFSDASSINGKVVNIDVVALYLDVFSLFHAVSRVYSKNYKFLLEPIIPDIKEFVKGITIDYELKDKEWKSYSPATYRFYFGNNRSITLKELIKKNKKINC